MTLTLPWAWSNFWAWKLKQSENICGITKRVKLPAIPALYLKTKHNNLSSSVSLTAEHYYLWDEICIWQLHKLFHSNNKALDCLVLYMNCSVLICALVDVGLVRTQNKDTRSQLPLPFALPWQSRTCSHNLSIHSSMRTHTHTHLFGMFNLFSSISYA